MYGHTLSLHEARPVWAGPVGTRGRERVGAGEGGVAHRYEARRARVRCQLRDRREAAGERAHVGEVLAVGTVLVERRDAGAGARQQQVVAGAGEAAEHVVALGDQLAPAARTELSGCAVAVRSEEHTSELQSLMRISYAVFCLKKQNRTT